MLFLVCKKYHAMNTVERTTDLSVRSMHRASSKYIASLSTDDEGGCIRPISKLMPTIGALLPEDRGPLKAEQYTYA